MLCQALSQYCASFHGIPRVQGDQEHHERRSLWGDGIDKHHTSCDVLLAVMSRLSPKQRWDCRGVCKCWAMVVGGARLVRKVKPGKLLETLQDAARLGRHSRQLTLTIRVEDSLDVLQSADMLRNIVVPANAISACRIELCILATAQQQVCKHLEGVAAREIASAATQLQLHNRFVRLTLQTAVGHLHPLNSASLQQLSPFLETAVFHAAPALLMGGDFLQHPAVAFTEDHFYALQSAKGLLKTLCLSDSAEPAPQYAGAGLCNSIGALPTFTSLVRLHLSVLNQNPDWQPLAQLSGLHDLALQCQEDMSSCAQVLISNRANLQHVVIASRSWDYDTYAALPGLQSLRSISIKVDTLTFPEATVVGNLPAPLDIRILIRRCGTVTPYVFRALSSGTAAITNLVVWELSKAHCRELQQMQHLALLAIMRPGHDVNVTDLKPQQGLKILHLFSCFGIDDSGVQYITAAFPSLRTVSVLHEVQFRAPMDLPIISVEAVVSLAQGQLLEHMYIGGLTGLTRQGIKALKHAIKAQQSAGLSPETVFIVLPSLSEADGGKMTTCDNLAFPCFEFATNELGFVISSLLVVGRSDNIGDSIPYQLTAQRLDRYFTARLWPARILMQ